MNVMMYVSMMVYSSYQQTVLSQRKDGFRMAHGSCFKNYMYKDRYEVFDAIKNTGAEVFMWTGDAIYANYPFLLGFFPVRFSLDEVDRLFHELKTDARMWRDDVDYSSMRENMKVIGMWDDHDYGMHDGDSTNKERDWFKKRFLDFLDEGEGSERRRNGEGIYTSYYGDVGKIVKIVMMDIHYSRDGDDDLGRSFVK